MKPERWKEIEKLYNAAMELDPARRAAFLAEACAGDEPLRMEVESLLAQSDKAGSFIDAPAMEKVARDLGPGPEPVRGDNEARSKRAPWWMFAVAAACLICAAVYIYAYWTEPENPGIQYQTFIDKDGSFALSVINDVISDSAAASAGLEKGDVLLDYFTIAANNPFFWRAGHTYPLQIRRGTEKRVLLLTPRPKHWLNWRERMIFAYKMFFIALLLVLGAAIAFARPYDPLARWGALWLAALAIGGFASRQDPLGSWSILTDLPLVIGLLAALLPSILIGFNCSIAITFWAIFPRTLFRK
jgi:hypothetical protein